MFPGVVVGLVFLPVLCLFYLTAPRVIVSFTYESLSLILAAFSRNDGLPFISYLDHTEQL
jgi:hypothetical protein